MTEHEDDEGYDNWKDSTPRRSQRTRFRALEEKEEKTAKRDKRSSKRSHRQKTHKDDDWLDVDD
jgi:hypothetical protein